MTPICSLPRPLAAWPLRLRVLAALAVALGSVGCSGGGTRSSARTPSASARGAGIESEQARLWMSEHQHVVAIHRAKCGACHTPVEPGSVPRAEVASALQRHRHRAKLSEKDWADMVEYLASDGPLFPRRSASLP